MENSHAHTKNADEITQGVNKINVFHIQIILVSDSKDIQFFLNMQMFVEYKCLFQHPDLNWTGYIHGTPSPPASVIPLPHSPRGKMPNTGVQLLTKIFPKFSGFENQTPIQSPISNPIRDRDSKPKPKPAQSASHPDKKSKHKTIPYRVSVGITGCGMIFREMEL